MPFIARLLLFVALAFGAALPAAAQLLRLDQLPDGPLGERALYFQEAPGGKPLSLAEARAALARGEFRRDERPVASLGIGARPVWIYLELFNPLDEPLPLRLTAGMSWIDRLDVAQMRGDEVLASWDSGDAAGPVDGAANVTPGEGFVFPLSVPPGRSEIFIRAESPDPLVMPLRLVHGAAVAAQDRGLHYAYGLLYGFLLALIAYNTTLFAGLRKGSYLYYAAYLLCFIGLNISYTGHGYAVLWPGSAHFQRYVILVMMVVFGVSGFAFAAHFLALRQHARRLWRGLAASAASVLGLMAAWVLLDRHEAAAWTAFVYLFAFTVGMVLLGFWAVGRRLRASPFFLAAGLCGMGGAGLTTLAVWGFIPMTGLTYHGMEIGVMLEATLLALALASQMRGFEQARHQAEEQARTDSLTGLANRRAFFERARGIWATAQRRGRPLSAVMLDIDHFKDFNDHHGHDGGDQVLVRVAELLRQSCRAGDVSARWGGEEFLLLLPETDLGQALAFAERLRARVENEAIVLDTAKVTVTISLGVAVMGSQPSLEKLINEADAQLYTAKNAGRNRVAGSPSTAAPGPASDPA